MFPIVPLDDRAAGEPFSRRKEVAWHAGPGKPAGESAAAPVSDEAERRQRIYGPFLSRAEAFAG
jgi:hypothetical protein